MVCTGCCATLDNIVTYLFKKVTSKGALSCVLLPILTVFWIRIRGIEGLSADSGR